MEFQQRKENGMARIFGWATMAALIVLIGVTLIGRAIDTEIADRVILTRDGVTLDCERVLRGHGAYYEDCHTVP